MGLLSFHNSKNRAQFNISTSQEPTTKTYLCRIAQSSPLMLNVK